MTNYTEDELAELLKQGGVRIVEHVEVDPIHPVLGNEPLGKPMVRKRRKGIPVPKEHCLKHGSRFQSKTEAESMAFLLYREPRKLIYEPITFRMPGGNYTPDWMMITSSGERVFFEVKGAAGFKAYKSGRSSKKSLIEAAYHFSDMGEFRLLVKTKKGGWYEEVV